MMLPDAPPDQIDLLRTTLERVAQAAPTETGHPALPLRLGAAEGEDAAYMRAVLDVLGWLGAVRREGDLVVVASAQAGYMVRLLLALLETQQPLVADWTGEGTRSPAPQPLERAVDVLAALEQRRLHLNPHALPLREVQAAVGLVEHYDEAGRAACLVFWDKIGVWQLIGGRRERHDRSLHDTMLRELAEELQAPALREPEQVVLAELGTPFAQERLSPTYGMLTRTIFQCYRVDFRGPVPSLPERVRRVSRAELLAGKTTDGQPIDAALLLALCEQQAISFDRLLPD
jgi:8-oxo-dGTP pyrophosphatase MutT (NUDIX family)